MIINRLVQSLRRRDWFTVVVEIVIVVVGVFIGIEVSNWNEDRQNRILAESHLERLVSDLESEAIAWEDVLQYFSTTRKHAGSALQAFHSDVETLDESFLIDLYQASQERNLSIRTATYDELLATGGIEFLPERVSREILGIHYDLSQRIQRVVGDITNYRPVLRRYMDYRVQEAIVDACGDTYITHEFGYRGIELPETCEIHLPDALVRQEVLRLHENEIVHQHLRYQFSNLRSRIAALENMLKGTRNTLAELRPQTRVSQ